ncbi:MAG: hypothetical protein MAG795_01202 [Candidatus Woesearchaeota archaeon]|nr:hypothetical protein [Candidatus Woesearchaeota archaeon]
MAAKDILSVRDELNLYLVVNGLKPAAIIGLDPIDQRIGQEPELIEEPELGVPMKLYRARPDAIVKFEEILGNNGIASKHWTESKDQTGYDSDGRVNKVWRRMLHKAYIGSDQVALERLLTADSDEEIGLALGFPIEAVSAFNHVIEGVCRDGQYDQAQKAKAVQAGLKLPTWLAYISFVPDQLDIVTGDISQSSREVGENYHSFVKENNPNLAKRVEEHFLQRKLPNEWEMEPNGSYTVTFRYDGMKITTRT